MGGACQAPQRTAAHVTDFHLAAACFPSALQAQDESRAAPPKPLNEPQHLLLPGAVRLPLLGLGTYQLQSADAVRKALERELLAGLAVCRNCADCEQPPAALCCRPCCCPCYWAQVSSCIALILRARWAHCCAPLLPPCPAVGYRHIDCASVCEWHLLTGLAC